MNKHILLLTLLTFIVACDDEEKTVTEPTLRDATVEENSAGNSDSDLGIEYYDFDTISIEPDLDFGPDMDD